MKKIFLLATAFVFTLASFGQTEQPKAEDLIKVNAEKHDFGKILQGTPVTYTFEIKNVSDKPIVIENTYASCGCTTPEKIVDPILPGKTVPLKVQYNAAAASVSVVVVALESGRRDIGMRHQVAEDRIAIRIETHQQLVQIQRLTPE